MRLGCHLIAAITVAGGAVAMVSGAPGGDARHRLSSQDTQAVVGVSGGMPALLSLRCRATGTEWVARPVGIPLIEFAEADRTTTQLRWRFEGSSTTRGNGTAVTLRFSSEPRLLEVRSVWTARPGPGPVSHCAEIRNLTDRDLLLPLQQSLSVELHPKGRSSHLQAWWVERGGGTPTDVGVHREELDAGRRLSLLSTPRAEHNEPIPWVALQDGSRGGVYIGVQFSGLTRIELEPTDDGSVRILAGLDPGDRPYRTILHAGEVLQVPTVFIGAYRGEVDDGANRLHRYVERHIRPPVRDRSYPLLVNNSWGSGMAVDEALARRMIDDAAELGLELYHVDAGWYRTVGDWHTDLAKFPKGLEATAEYAKSKGLKFGLWVGWTQGGASDRPEALSVFRPGMREWFPHDLPPDWRPSDFTGQCVCLASKEAQNWLLNDLRRMIREYRLDLLEHDQWMLLDKCSRSDHGHTPHPTNVSYRCTLGYYRIYDTLRSEFPDLLFEDCLNGGRMVDFGVAQRVHYICATDTYDPLSNRRGFWDASYPLPPSMVESYVGHYPGKTLANFLYMLRSGMMGWCTIMCDTTQWTAEQHRTAKRQFEVYKTWIRPLINSANLYHLTQRPDGVRWDAVQYFDPKTGRGVMFVFRGTTAQDRETLRLKGLRPERQYRLRFEDGTSPELTASGRELIEAGLKVTLPEAESSELVYIEEH
ncbi:MAG: alpha-galactosidase [Armatimonadota bacterium]